MECKPCDEGLKVRTAPKPVMPSAGEVEAHNANHIPFCNWCPYCVAGKAKAEPHRQKDETNESSIPVVSIDYAFIGNKAVREGPAEDESEADSEREEADVPESETKQTLTVLVLRDRKSKYVTASVVPRKGNHPYTVDRVGTDIANALGYKRVIFMSDQERSIKKLKAAV